MKTLQISKIDKRVLLTLPSSPKSAYAIFNFILSLLLIISIAYIFYLVRPYILKAAAIALIPIALFIFNFKVNIWNLFGVETIVVYSNKITSTLNYKHIYSSKTAEHKVNKKNLKLISSKDASKLEINSQELKEHKKNKFRLYFEANDKKVYQSSNFVTYEDVLALKEALKI